MYESSATPGIGNKRQMQAPNLAPTIYEGAFEYLGGVLQRIGTEEGQLIRDASGNYTAQYYLKDHLGSVRQVISETGTVLQETEYYPFGLPIVRNGGAANKYLYNGKEVQPSTNWQDYGARMYDGAIGRFFTVDPHAHKMPFASPYAYCLNNPINMIDPDGRIPYPITIRGFAPFIVFGFGFHGDGRGYSTGNVSARVHQKINFDTDKTTINTSAWSSPSSHSLNPNYKKTATPSVNFTGDFTINQNGDNKKFGFGSHVAEANPLTPPGSPNIDIFSNFSVTENKKAGTLNVSGSLTGDNFPSTEAFMTDPKGNNVFIGVGQIAAGVDANTGPFTELPGENSTNPITSFNITISTDKKGNFTGVTEGKTTYSIADWNKRFTSQPTQKQE